MVRLDQFRSLRNDAANALFAVLVAEDCDGDARAAPVNSGYGLGLGQLRKGEPDDGCTKRRADSGNAGGGFDLGHGVHAGQEA